METSYSYIQIQEKYKKQENIFDSNANNSFSWSIFIFFWANTNY